MTINPPVVCDSCENSRVCVDIQEQQTYLVCVKSDGKACHNLPRCPIHLDLRLKM